MMVGKARSRSSRERRSALSHAMDVRQCGMLLYSKPLIVESTLSPGELRERVREMRTSRWEKHARSRPSRVLAWEVSERADGFSLQPIYVRGRRVVRFVGTIEASGNGSRIVGRVEHPWFTRVATSVFMTVFAVAGVRAFVQDTDPTFKTVWLSATMIGLCTVLLRWELRSVAALIVTGLRLATGNPATLDAAD